MHKKLERENCFDRVWSFILSGNKNLEKNDTLCCSEQSKMFTKFSSLHRCRTG